jgi:hypothetical protein
MIDVIVPLAIGALLLGLMLYWLLQGDPSAKINLAEARSALGSLQSKFLPVDLVDRILDHDDFIFVDNQKDPRLLQLLEAERKAIAMYWLRHTREQVKLLMNFYVRTARHNAKLAAALELKLAFNYVAFLMACDALCSLIWLRGPFYAPKVARWTIVVTTRFCAASDKILTIAEAGRPSLPEAPGHKSPAGG